MNKRIVTAIAFLAGLGVMALAVFTAGAMRPLPQSLASVAGPGQGAVLLDRHGRRILAEPGEWNRNDQIPLAHIPEFMRRAVTLAEDKRFYSHHGVDWLARLHALWQCAVNLRPVRGASTISEQVVKMIHPRPRSAWARWVEGFEAMELETYVSKEEILEFYINQVPYAANRRGAVQAARYYFDRELGSLTKKEMLAMAVLPRRPSGYDLYNHPGRIKDQIETLSRAMASEGFVSPQERAWIRDHPIRLKKPENDVDAFHFANYALSLLPKESIPQGPVRTSLDLSLQRAVALLLEERMLALSRINAVNAAVLVADHSTGQILAWAAYGDREKGHPGAYINAVLAPRQPGSSLKPFLYALALETGWTGATILRDEPLDTQVGAGLHSFRNYSRSFYGPITLRESLANSLNIPAVLTLRHAGREPYLALLRKMGIDSLDKSAEYYGDALALGAGEISLYEMTEAYTALANGGVLKPLTAFMEPAVTGGGTKIFTRETASLIASILSDPAARRLEFPSGALSFPTQTAVKTGTSTDYKDAWAFGYDGKRLVGIWMGNLSRAPSSGLTGASGPALLLRSVFSLLNRDQPAGPLYMSPRLVKTKICVEGASVRQADDACMAREEWFLPGAEPAMVETASAPTAPRLAHPVNGLQLAMDPRVPPERQAVEFKVEGMADGDRVEWRLDGSLLAVTDGQRYVWPLSRGEHRLTAAILAQGSRIELTREPVEFIVK